MKLSSIITVAAIAILTVLAAEVKAHDHGHGHGEGHGHGNAFGHDKMHGYDKHEAKREEVHYKESRHEDKKYYVPSWNPNRRFERRWVYFPTYNVYWDNYRNVYVYQNKGRWITTNSIPRSLSNRDLSRERCLELEPNCDQQDEVYVKRPHATITINL